MTNGEGTLLQVIGVLVVAAWGASCTWFNNRFNSLKSDHRSLEDKKLSVSVFTEFKENNHDDHMRQEKLMSDFVNKQDNFMQERIRKEELLWVEIAKKQDQKTQ